MEVATNVYNLLKKFEKQFGFQSDLKWDFTVTLSTVHIFGFYWSYLYAFPAKWQTLLFAGVMYWISITGISVGVHRLWSHKSFKAKLPVRIFLMISYASAAQHSIYWWVRDHRLHHKFSDTPADPNNPSRGFWFAHVGHLLLKKSDLVLEKGHQTDMSDIMQDPVAAFERKYSAWVRLMFAFVLPTVTGIWLWGEDWKCAVAWQCFIRILAVFHALMSINSFSHLYGYRPYNKNIRPTQNWVTGLATIGSDGGHNYHHAFPNDYKSAENVDFFNSSTNFIRILAKTGLVYDLKEPTPALVRAVVNKQKLDLNE